MTKDEVLKLALEALETVRHKIDSYQVNVCDDVDEAITAIREALAQPEPGGVCVRCGGWVCDPIPELAQPEQGSVAYWHKEFLKHNTTSDQPEQEPVIDKSAAIRIATALGWEPKRKPLTEPELHAINPTWPAPGQEWGYEEVLAFARAIEAAHGIKGEA